MSDRDWFRSRTWDEAARTRFDTKIRRARKGFSRAQYFWVQAGSLFYARPTEPALRRAAIELLERALVESGAEAGDRTTLLDHLGRFQLIAGDRAAGIRTLEAALAGARSFHAHDPPTEIVLARRRLEDGDRAEAARLFDVAYAQMFAPPTSYAELAAREIVDVQGAPYRDPEDAAEAIVVYYHAEDEHPAVDEVYAGDLGALAALDRIYATEVDLVRTLHPRTAYKRDFVETQFLPELGAFVGRALVKAGGGRWRAAAPLMQSRVVNGARELDPFRIAYDCVYYELPLAALAAEALAR